MVRMLHIKVSPKQLSKLRNGHQVRVNEAMQGQGVNLIVHPERYDTVCKCFKKKKGVQIQLTPEEIMANKLAHPKMEGTGIFGRDFDNFIEKTIGTKAKDVIYKGADELKPLVKEAVGKVSDYAPEIGASALSGLAVALGQPQLVPVAGMVGKQLGSMAGKAGKDFANEYLDNPEKFQGYSGNTGNKDVNAPKTLQGAVEHNETLQAMNRDLGTQYGNLARQTLGNLDAHRIRAGVSRLQDMTRPEIVPEYMRRPDMFDPDQVNMQPRTRSKPKKGKKKGKGMEGEGLQNDHRLDGSGLYAGGGYGLYASGRAGCGMYAGGGMRREHSTIGRGGGFVGANASLPQALQSQPMASNFQFRYTLPPQYQRL
jgi:hypothetical protein